MTTMDGDDVTGITIDGDEVTEITMDGDVVWSGVDTPPITDGLEYQYEAQSFDGGSWTDERNGVTLSSYSGTASSTSNWRNGEPAISFSGSEYYSTSDSRVSAPLTVVVVGEITTTERSFFQNHHGEEAGWQHHIGHYINDAAYRGISGGTTFGPDAGPYGRTTWVNLPVFAAVTINGSDSKAKINQIDESGGVDAKTFSGPRIGSQYHPLYGYIGTALWYDRPLLWSELGSLYDHYKTRYNLYDL